MAAGVSAMVKLLSMTAIVGLCLATPAYAKNDKEKHGNNGHHKAPEAVTLLVLGLGAGGAALARWRSKRRP